MDEQFLVDYMTDNSSGRSNDTFSYDFLKLHPTLSVAYLSVLCTFTLTGNLGNIMVILTIIISKKLRTTGNMFIVNLAIADLCVTTIVDPFSILGVFGGPQFFEDKTMLCHVVASICLTSCVCSMWNIAGIAVNRYVFLCRHYIYEDIYTWRKTVLICIGLWCICALLEMPNYFGWGGHTYDMKTWACSYDRMGDYTYTLFFCCVAIGLPLVAVLVSYLKIFLYVRKIRLEMQKISEQRSDLSVKRRNEEIKLAKTLFIVFVVFLVCWSPYAVVVLIDMYDEWPRVVYLVVIQMAHTNSSINSILYGVTNKSFRDGYKKVLMFLCCRLRKNGQSCCSMKTVDDFELSSTDSNQGKSKITSVKKGDKKYASRTSVKVYLIDSVESINRSVTDEK